LAQLSEGDIINPGRLDNNLIDNYQVWFKCDTQVECIAMARPQFEPFWKAQVSFGKETLYLIIKRIPLFKDVSEVTMHKIVYELLKTETWDANKVVYNDLSYYAHTQKRTKMQLEKLTLNSSTQDPVTQQLHHRRKTQRNGMIKFTQEVISSVSEKKKKDKSQRGIFIILEGQCGVYSHEGQ
jgi:hypothetical protein